MTARVKISQNFDILAKVYLVHLKPLHTIDKVSVNASILCKNEEICNKTNL